MTSETMLNDTDAGTDPASHTEYAKVLHSLRESRRAVLRQCGVTDEEALLERILRGELDVETAYDHYLAARVIEQTRQQLREDLMALIGGDPAAKVTEASFHLAFKSMLESCYGDRLCEEVRMAQDALLLAFDNGMTMELRYAGPDAFSVRWESGDAAFRLDTSPLDDGSHGRPHLHFGDGRVQPFVPRAPGESPCDWLSALLDLLLENPVLAGIADEAPAGPASHAAE